MSLYHGYQGAVRCTAGPTPGARALMAWFLGAYAAQGGVNTGIYNCRAVRGGTTTSLHGEGRAADLGIRPYSAAYGTALAESLRLHSHELGIQLIIWNKRVWSGSYPDAGWRPYTGVASHTDHLHVELGWYTARDNPLTVAHLNNVLRPAPKPAPMPTPAPAPGVRMLKLTTPHMEGADVRRVQEVLARWYSLGAGWADGDFGPATHDYVRRVQRSTPPPPVLDDDGIVGPATLRKLGLA